MKYDDLVDKVAFSHRPQDGISIGVAVVAGVAYLSAGFVRTGDSFNRGLVRRIITQRIISTIETNKKISLVCVAENLPEKVDARSILRELRKIFKPDPLCNDATFATTTKLGEVTFRSPSSRHVAWGKIVVMFSHAVAAAGTQAVV